jgi:hypothetical protein
MKDKDANMAKILVVTSGKGGVGKTTSSAAIGTALALRGFKTVIIDFDVGLRNLDLIMGCERRVVYDLINVVHGEATLNQALIKDKRVDNLYILPASQTRDKDALTQKGIEKILKDLDKEHKFDYVVCDSPAGIEKGAMLAMYYADEAVVVALRAYGLNLGLAFQLADDALELLAGIPTIIYGYFALFFVTNLLGRVWCGYTCPQTIWTAIFMWVEQITEGERHQRYGGDGACQREQCNVRP